MSLVPDVDHQVEHSDLVPDVLDSPIPSATLVKSPALLPRLHLIDEQQKFR